MLYKLYAHYHRIMWAYKQAHQSFQRRDLILTLMAALITSTGLAGATIVTIDVPAVAIGMWNYTRSDCKKKRIPLQD